MPTRVERWVEQTERTIALELGGARLELHDLRAHEEGASGGLRLTATGASSALIAGVASDLHVTAGRPRPSHDAPLPGVEGGVVVFARAASVLHAKLTIETPVDDPVEVYLDVEDGVATFRPKDDDWNAAVVTALCRGLRDGTTWDPEVGALGERAFDPDQLVALLGRDGMREWESIVAWTKSDPDAARARVPRVLAEMDRVRTTKRPTRERALLLANGRAFLARAGAPAHAAELARQLDDPDDYVRRNARMAVESVLRKGEAVDRAACIAALDRFVSRLRDPRAEIEQAIALRAKLAARPPR